MKKILERVIAVLGWPLVGLAIAHGIFGPSPWAYGIFMALGLALGIFIPSVLGKDGDNA